MKAKTLLLGISLLLSLSFYSGCGRQVPLGEQPMYGGIPPTPKLKAIHNLYIQGAIEGEGSREAATQVALGLAYKHYNRGELEIAMKRFNQAWLLDPENEGVYFGFARILEKKKQFDEGIVMYTKTIQLNPEYGNGLAYHNRGLIYYHQGKFSQAIEDFTKALAIDPNNTQAYNDRGVAYCRIGEYDKSWQDVHKAEELGYEILPWFIEKLKKLSERER